MIPRNYQKPSESAEVIVIFLGMMIAGLFAACGEAETWDDNSFDSRSNWYSKGTDSRTS